jgi:hypothetical protein
MHELLGAVFLRKSSLRWIPKMKMIPQADNRKQLKLKVVNFRPVLSTEVSKNTNSNTLHTKTIYSVKFHG